MQAPPHVRNFASDRGWWLGHIGPIYVTYFGTSATPESFAHYVRAMAAEIDDRVETDRIGGLFWMPDARAIKPSYRQSVADVLSKRREKLKRTTPAFVIVTESILVRSLIQTVKFFAPPPYPNTTEKDVPHGLAYLAKHMPQLDTARWYDQFVEAQRVALPWIGEQTKTLPTLHA